jgi:hypothetical protein
VSSTRLYMRNGMAITKLRFRIAAWSLKRKPRPRVQQERGFASPHSRAHPDAYSDKAYGAAVAAVMGKAKILNLILDQPSSNSVDFSSANSMQDIGRTLVQSVGFASPDDASIQAAIEANDVFVGRLEAIRDGAHGLTIDQND